MVTFVLAGATFVVLWFAVIVVGLRWSQHVRRDGEVASMVVAVLYHDSPSGQRVPARLEVSRDRIRVRPFLPFVKPMSFERRDVGRLVVHPTRTSEHLTVESAGGRRLDDRRLIAGYRAVHLLRDAGWLVVDPREQQEPGASADAG